MNLVKAKNAPQTRSDVRNITHMDNTFGCTFTADIFNYESYLHLFPVVPDHVVLNPGEEKGSGGMWTPWCDSQQELEEGHYIVITMKKGHDEQLTQVFHVFQHGPNVYVTPNKQFNNKYIIGGDFNSGKGEYSLDIKESSPGELSFYLDKY
jgi:hypothetical protein